MHVRIRTIPRTEEESAELRVHEVTQEVEQAAALLQGQRGTLIGSRDGEKFLLPIGDIYYLESVDDRTFAYTRRETYELSERLASLEASLGPGFFRSSRSQIVNISVISSVRSEMNGRMMATLLSGEKLVVSRKYVKELKKRLGL